MNEEVKHTAGLRERCDHSSQSWGAIDEGIWCDECNGYVPDKQLRGGPQTANEVKDADNSYTLELFLKVHSTSRVSLANSRWLVWNEDQWEVYEQPYRRKVSRTLATNSLGKALQALEADNGQS